MEYMKVLDCNTVSLSGCRSAISGTWHYSSLGRQSCDFAPDCCLNATCCCSTSVASCYAYIYSITITSSRLDNKTILSVIIFLLPIPSKIHVRLLLSSPNTVKPLICQG